MKQQKRVKRDASERGDVPAGYPAAIGASNDRAMASSRASANAPTAQSAAGGRTAGVSGALPSADADTAAARDAVPARRPRSAVARRLWGAAGLVAFGLGTAGAVLPVLPTVPFILLAAFCFARSSERADAWFRGTRLYATVLESYVERRQMDLRAKLTILIPVTILLGIAAFFMRSITPMLVLFAVVWLGHVVYFGFMVKGEGKARP